MLNHYKYIAVDTEGNRATGEIVSDSKTSAFEQLQRKNLEPIKIDLLEQSKKLNHGKNTRLPLENQVRLFKKLFVLSKAQAPILECLKICLTQEKHKPTKNYISYLAEKVSSGYRLSDAIKTNDKFKSQLIYALVLTAEHSGNFSACFDQITRSLESQVANKKSMIQQLIYPAILGLFVILTLIFISFFVLPQFEDIFNQSDVKTPTITWIVLSTGAWIRNWAAFFPVIILATTTIAIILTKKYADAIDRIIIATPKIGSFMNFVYAERFCRALGTLVQGGVPLARGLDIAAVVISNTIVLKRANAVTERIKRGERFYTSSRSENYLPEEVASLVEVGERTGQLGQMLINAANLCQDEVDYELKKFTTILSPVMTAIAGAVVAVVISAILIGIMSLNESIY